MIFFLTGYLSVTQNSWLPSGGDQDVRCGVLFTVNLNTWFRVICKPGMTLNGLDFSLKSVQMKETGNKQEIISEPKNLCEMI